MEGRLAKLTEKEREALRLLLAGHDAKSSAAELDLSVHTINDRLRNARRKLGVSSSREAARILGDAEGRHPKPWHPHLSGWATTTRLPILQSSLTRAEPEHPASHGSQEEC